MTLTLYHIGFNQRHYAVISEDVTLNGDACKSLIIVYKEIVSLPN